MQPGPKKQPRQVKAARNTLQPVRDGAAPVKTAAVAAPVAAVMTLVPPELPMDVADVWAEYVDAAVANGARQCDVEAFAEWCAMASVLRRARNAPAEDEQGNTITQATPAPASYVAQFRMLGELLGLAGPGSRVTSKGVEAAKSNPFARNGRR